MTEDRGGVEVRDVRGAAGLRACQALQRRTWGITEDGYVVPVATMAGAQRVGGSVLGAYVGGDLDKLAEHYGVPVVDSIEHLTMVATEHGCTLDRIIAVAEGHDV